MKQWKRYLIGMVALAALLTAQLSSQTWTSIGTPQVASNVKDISIDNTGDIIYVAENGYVMKSTNGGSSWFVTPMPYAAPSVILTKPDEANIVVVAKSGGLSYNDQGGGGTTGWDPIPNVGSLEPLRLVAAQNDPSKMLLGRKQNAGTNRTIWRSPNGGATWDAIEQFNSPTDVNDFSPYPRNTDGSDRIELILAVGSAPPGQLPQGQSDASPAVNAGLWKSADYGANWEALDLGNSDLVSVAILPKPLGTDYLRFVVEKPASGNYLVRRSISVANPNWVTMFSGAPIVRMVRVKGSNNYIFLATSSGVYRSTDEGANWTPQNSGLGTDTDILSIAVSKTGNTVLAGTANSLYKSTDNGVTWKNVGKINRSSVVSSSGK